MQDISSTSKNPKATPTILRAIVEIEGAELRVYPLSDCDSDELRIMEALRFVREDAQ